MVAISTAPIDPQPLPSARGRGRVIGLMMALLFLLIVGRHYHLMDRHVEEKPLEAMRLANPDVALKFRLQGCLNSLAMGLMSYRTTTGMLPTTEQGLDALVVKPTVAPVPAKYRPIMKMMRDPWGREFRYQTPAVRSHEKYDVWSAGADGVDGTADDFGNWKEGDE